MTAAHFQQIVETLPPGNDSQWGEHAVWRWQGLCCHWRFLGKPKHLPLLLLHGFGTSSAHWRHNATAFVNAGYQVYALDLVGFGQSDQPGLRRQRLNNYIWSKQVAAFLEQVVRVNERGPAILIGNSLGALIALTTATLHRRLVAGVVAAPLPDPVLARAAIPYGKLSCFRWGNKATAVLCRILPLEILLPLITNTPLILVALQAAYHRPINSDRELQQLIKRPAQRHTAPSTLRAMCVGMALRPQRSTAPALLQRLGSIGQRPPFLLLWGRQDRFVPLRLGIHLQQEHPWLQLAVLDNCGHCPHDEVPDSFQAVVMDWLERNLRNSK